MKKSTAGSLEGKAQQLRYSLFSRVSEIVDMQALVYAPKFHFMSSASRLDV